MLPRGAHGMLVLETAASKWFSDLSDEEQRHYVAEHPGSKYARRAAAPRPLKKIDVFVKRARIGRTHTYADDHHEAVLPDGTVLGRFPSPADSAHALLVHHNETQPSAPAAPSKPNRVRRVAPDAPMPTPKLQAMDPLMTGRPSSTAERDRALRQLDAMQPLDARKDPSLYGLKAVKIRDFGFRHESRSFGVDTGDIYARAKTQPVQAVPIKGMLTGQEHVNLPKVRHYVSEGIPESHESNLMPIVLRHPNGKYQMVDGNHRMVATHLLGGTHIHARVVDRNDVQKAARPRRVR